MAELRVSTGRKKTTVTVEGDVVTIVRERPANRDERGRDPEAKVMADTVSIVFGGDGAPEIRHEGVLCA